MTIMNSFVYEFDTEQAENTKCAERQKFRLKQKNRLKMQACLNQY